MSFEESLIRYVAPTLAGIKVANLYNYQFSSQEECLHSIELFNHRLNHKGVYIELMNSKNDFYLLYVYRKQQLLNLLNNTSIRLFLKECGYSMDDKMDISNCIEILKNKIKKAVDFPHEIGIFLGYPLIDVKDFIRCKGKNYAICGEWKVYHDVHNAQCFFCKLKRCKEAYYRIYSNGKRSLYDMTVNI